MVSCTLLHIILHRRPFIQNEMWTFVDRLPSRIHGKFTSNPTEPPVASAISFLFIKRETAAVSISAKSIKLGIDKLHVATYPNEVVAGSERTGRASSHAMDGQQKRGLSPTKYLTSILSKVVV
jgi:hypothetical protein